jgi:hypothetical protein
VGLVVVCATRSAKEIYEMPNLLTMPDLTWNVRVFDSVSQFVWEYKFSRDGNKVTWRDTWNGMSGQGTWAIDGDTMTTTWSGSTTTEAWKVPIDPTFATGTCNMKGKEYKLEAVAQDYFLHPGDVVYSGVPLDSVNPPWPATIIYEHEVRTGGTIAWICNNPGNISAWKPGAAESLGAYKGKHLNVPSVNGRYAIFPNEDAGFKAIGLNLTGGGYRGLTIREAMYKYAPPEHKGNNPEAYIRTITSALNLKDTDRLPTGGEQLVRMAKAITGQEGTKPGRQWPRDSPDLPNDIRLRLPPP